MRKLQHIRGFSDRMLDEVQELAEQLGWKDILGASIRMFRPSTKKTSTEMLLKSNRYPSILSTTPWLRKTLEGEASGEMLKPAVPSLNGVGTGWNSIKSFGLAKDAQVGVAMSMMNLEACAVYTMKDGTQMRLPIDFQMSINRGSARISTKVTLKTGHV